MTLLSGTSCSPQGFSVMTLWWHHCHPLISCQLENVALHGRCYLEQPCTWHCAPGVHTQLHTHLCHPTPVPRHCPGVSPPLCPVTLTWGGVSHTPGWVKGSGSDPSAAPLPTAPQRGHRPTPGGTRAGIAAIPAGIAPITCPTSHQQTLVKWSKP